MMFCSPNAVWQLVHCTVTWGKAGAALSTAYTHACAGEFSMKSQSVRVHSTAGAALHRIRAAN